VTGGDVKGRNPFARTQNQADQLILINQLGRGPAFWARCCVLAAKAALGDSDRRQIREQAEVAGDAEAARVCEAVAVDEQEVWLALQFRERLSQHGSLAERKETGDVGEGDGGFDYMMFDERQLGIRDENDGGASETRLSPVRAVDEGDVGGGDVANVAWVAMRYHLRGELRLERDRLARAKIPGVKVAEEHGK
jgi:hypothetical protein